MAIYVAFIPCPAINALVLLCRPMPLPSIKALGSCPAVDQSPLIGHFRVIDYFPPLGPCPAEWRPFSF